MTHNPLFMFAACWLTSLFVAPHLQATKRPNVLFIAVDDLRCELGCYGVDEIKSPRIDALAAQSVQFNRAYCQQAVCNPSRASLMTGLRPDSTKVWDLVTHFRDTVPNVVTLPQHFRKHGYYAVAYGKIFHNPLPDAKSWDEPNHWPKQARVWSAASLQRRNAYREQMRADGKSEPAIARMRAPATDDEDVPDHQRPDGDIAQQAMEALSQLAEKDQPFFLAVGFINPHLPFNAPKRYWDLYDPAKLQLADNSVPPQGAPPIAMNTMYELRDYMDFAGTPAPDKGALTEAQQRRLKHGYYASVSYIDTMIGRLLDELDRLKLRNDTIIVLWGDHGWKLGEHRSWCKQTNYEIDTRAPLLISVPGTQRKGTKCEAIVEFVDVYPTLCDAAGLPLPKHLQGQSLAPLLKNPQAAWRNEAISQFPRRTKEGKLMGYALRTDQFRYVEWLGQRNCETQLVELYDHATDPDENRNVAEDAKYRSQVKKLSTTLWRKIDKPQPSDFSQAQAGPNILFLMGDDWSWPHAGFLGDKVVKTPTFDTLARSGVVFENAFVSSPSCTPSRFAVATGQWHWRLGEGANLGGSLGKDVPVYPDILAAQGYATGYARKGAGPSKHLFRGTDPFGKRFENFASFLKQRQPQQPFCFWYGAGEPHRPYRAGTGAKRGYRPEDIKVPAYLPDNAVVRSDICDYYEAIERFDRDAGRMLKELEDAGELENTIIIVTGDNGMPFPRAKATLYDSGTRVPLVIYWPRGATGGRRVTDFVSLTDLAPTFLSAAGINIPDAMTGKSLLSILKSKVSDQVDPQRTSVLTGMEQHVYAYPARAIRTADFLFIRNFQPDAWPTGESDRPSPPIDFTDGSWPSFAGAFSYNMDPSPTKQQLLRQRDEADFQRYFDLACGRRPKVELFDLNKDPDQIHNIAGESAYTKQQQRLNDQLEAALGRSGDPRFAAQSTNTP